MCVVVFVVFLMSSVLEYLRAVETDTPLTSGHETPVWEAHPDLVDAVGCAVGSDAGQSGKCSHRSWRENCNQNFG